MNTYIFKSRYSNEKDIVIHEMDDEEAIEVLQENFPNHMNYRLHSTKEGVEVMDYFKCEECGAKVYDNEVTDDGCPHCTG
jgi:rubrerythrin